MKQLYLIITVALSIAFMTACSSDEPGTDNDRTDVGLNAAELVVSEDMGEFNTELLKVLVAREGEYDNIIVSPLSSAIFLSMLANISPEETQERIFKVLGSSDLDALNSFNAKMLANLGKLDRTTTLNLANSIWHAPMVTLETDTKETFSKYFATDFFSCDLSDSETKNRINDWIKSKTNNLITEAYNGDPFEVLLLNALYFNGKWKDKFDKSYTEKEKFHVGEKIYMVDMMKRLNVNEELAKGNNFTACRREFGNGAYTCTFILPAEDCEINDFIAGLTYDDISGLKFSSEECDLFVPKFEIRKHIEKYEDVLADLGVFAKDDSPKAIIGDKKLKAFHESYIKLDEDGAEVAAVTGGGIVTIDSWNPDKWRFRLDRPFIFMINETSTNACILTGRISKFK